MNVRYHRHGATQVVFTAAFGLIFAGPVSAEPISNVFTYQGQVKIDGAPLSDSADFKFTLWDQSGVGNGSMIGGEVFETIDVVNGLFSVELDFGADAFNGESRWIQIEIRSPAGGGSYTTLTPRQSVTATPYALQTRGLFVGDNGYVGVGTNAPHAPVTIKRASNYDAVGITQSHQNPNGTATMEFTTKDGNGTQASRLVLRGNAENTNVEFFRGNSGEEQQTMIIRGSDGHVGIGTNDPQELLDVAGVVRTQTLHLVGGADIAEPFHVRTDVDVRAGMVVSIDPETLGHLRLSSQAYDAKVAGIISGANEIKPGMTLSQTGTIADGEHPVALTGRVWTWCDADAGGSIRPGDMLTTSDTPGHGMKVNHPGRAQGAIIGKAMSTLDQGKGLVWVLVTLQ